MSGISLAAGEQLVWRQRGFVRMVAVGPQGPPGKDGAAMADADVAALVPASSGSQTAAALSDAIAAQVEQGFGVVEAVNLNTDPRPATTAWSPNGGAWTPQHVSDAPEFGDAVRSEVATGSTSNYVVSLYNIDSLGNYIGVRSYGCYVWVSDAGYQAHTADGDVVALDPQVWTWVTTRAQTGWAGLYVGTVDGSAVPAGVYGYAARCLCVAGDVVLPDYWDGDTPDDADFIYRWTGTPNASTSQKIRRLVALS